MRKMKKARKKSPAFALRTLLKLSGQFSPQRSGCSDHAACEQKQ